MSEEISAGKQARSSAASGSRFGVRLPGRWRAGLFAFVGNGVPLARKIIAFNLIAMTVLVAGILYLNASRESLALQEASALVGEVELVANVFETELGSGSEGLNVLETLDRLSLRNGVDVLVYNAGGLFLGQRRGSDQSEVLTVLAPNRSTSLIGKILDGFATIHAFVRPMPQQQVSLRDQLAGSVAQVLASGTQVESGFDKNGRTVFSALAPVIREGNPVAVVAMASPAGQIDSLVREERERVLQMFVVAILVSIGLSMVLASTIANPLAELAEAAELGRDRDTRKAYPGRVRIPDMGERPDEIGRLSRALRGMVSALYTRIDGNEQFAADVAHEIKNPLASLQSAVGTLRRVDRTDQRDRLLDVIELDVRRLDRLVSDISNASRLDAELVKEAAEPFNLIEMLNNLNAFLSDDAEGRDIIFVTDLPDERVEIFGLQERLAQVFVNLVANAVSFCSEGDAIRVWVRRRENRVLVVVEDTGPGIPDEALTKIFRRFYSQRPSEHFGSNSGLGLAISKQIVEAHGGVIWAENICPTDADPTSDPMGARFVVGLPV